MANKFTEIMAKRSDAELLKIVNDERNDYQTDAVEAAEKELAKRELSFEQINEAKKENEIKVQIESKKSNEKLGVFTKILAFLCPALILIVFAGVFKADGYDRKAKDLTKWTLYGFGFYLGLAIIIMVLHIA